MFDEKVLNDENEELNAEFDNNDGYFENYQNNALNKNSNVKYNFPSLIFLYIRISELVQAIQMPKFNILKLNLMEVMN
jgi:hypothetical protein